MTDELIKQLLEAGVHFGHQAKRWNPKMAKYIFGERKGIYIIDLEKTAAALSEARAFLTDLISKGHHVLFVGTKKQAQDVIKEEALRCRMFYVNRRWLGGLMTNYQTIKKSIARMVEIEKMKEDGIFEKLTKKEVASLTHEKEKLERNLLGIKDMGTLPAAVFIVDSKKEETAVKEANKLSIPIIGFIDTNCDPDFIDFPIPGNDDALKSIRLIVHLISDSVIEGRDKFLKGMEKPIVQETETKEEILITPEEKKQLEEIDLTIAEEKAKKAKRPPRIKPREVKKEKPEI